MYYIATKQTPKVHQMTLEELWFGADDLTNYEIGMSKGGTRTYATERINAKLLSATNVPQLTKYLENFNKSTVSLRAMPRENLYNTFYLEKRNKGIGTMIGGIYKLQSHHIGGDGSAVMRQVRTELRRLTTQHPTMDDKELRNDVFGKCVEVLTGAGFTITKDDMTRLFKENLRRIDAPNAELKRALGNLKDIFESCFGALYHTSAYAYVKDRSIADCMQRHADNESKWYAKYDLSNFFGSVTPEFLMQQMEMIYPFCEVCHTVNGYKELETALSLAFLNGGLPQGTPLSPMLTNIMMIPIDYTLCKALRDYNNQSFIYTRYADDFQISSKYGFSYREIEDFMKATLASFHAPFTVNESKTRYGSSSGRNWNLGLMVNRDNNVTVGYRKKRELKAGLTNYIMDKKNGHPWDKHDIMVLEGNRAYYKMIEGKTIDDIVNHLNRKFQVNVVQMMKDDIAG